MTPCRLDMDYKGVAEHDADYEPPKSVWDIYDLV